MNDIYIKCQSDLDVLDSTFGGQIIIDERDVYEYIASRGQDCYFPSISVSRRFVNPVRIVGRYGKINFKLSGSANVFSTEDSTKIMITAEEDSFAEILAGEVSVVARDRAKVVCSGKTRATLYDDSFAELYGETSLNAEGNSKAIMYEGGSAVAVDTAEVTSYNGAVVFAYNSSVVNSEKEPTLYNNAVWRKTL